MTKNSKLFSLFLTILASVLVTYSHITSAEPVVTIPFKEFITPYTETSMVMFDLRCTINANILYFKVNHKVSWVNSCNCSKSWTKIGKYITDLSPECDLFFGVVVDRVEKIIYKPILTLDLGPNGCYTCTGTAIDSAYSSGGNCTIDTVSSSDVNVYQGSSLDNEKSSIHSSISGVVSSMLTPFVKLISVLLLFI